jgi:methyl-accepting chemotaxis protein WspA
MVSPRDMSISTRLLLWFLAIALIPGAILAGVVEYITSDALESAVKRRLLVVTEAKAAAIDSFIRERRGDVSLAGHLQFVIGAVKTLAPVLEKGPATSDEYKEKSGPYRHTLSYYRDAYGYENAFIFSTDGTLLLRLGEGLDIGANLKQGPLKSSELAEAFDRALLLMQAVASDFQKYPGQEEPLGFVAHPILDADGVNLGVVVLQLGNETLFRVINDYNGLGETGEVVAGKQEGDEVVCVAPTRHDPDAAFRRKARIGSSQMALLQRGVLGGRGFDKGEDYRGARVWAVWNYIPSLRWGLVVKLDESEAYAAVRRQRILFGTIMGLTLVSVVSLALWVARSLSRPIRAAVAAADRVADGDLTAVVETKAKGEAGRLLSSIRKMTEDLRSLIGRIQKSSIQLMSAATEIAATSRQQEQTVHEYGTSTNEAAAAVKEISATGQELVKTMNELNSVAGQTAEMASHGRESLAGMDKTMRLLADSTSSIGSKLSVISERASGINFVVTTITKVADQTNLLSINAAIEAEKAGEYGLGFLVVAREIRRLADMTAVSTLDIERMVKEMQYSVSAGVMEMDKFSDQVRHGVREVAVIADQLGGIIGAVEGLKERFDHVTEGMRVQAQGADQIREAVVHLSDGVNQTLVSLREFNQATVQLREAVGGLKEEVSRFRVEA